ncbi:MAG: MFS transporter [Caldilineaceae bacterium]
MPPGHRAGPLGSAPGHAAVDAGHGGGQLGSPQPRPRRAGVGARLIGAGMAGVLMGSLKMFSQWFPVCRFATVSGLLVGIGSFGASCGHTLGLAQRVTIGWRNVFLVGAVVTAPFAAYIMLWTRNTPPGVEWTGNHVQQGSLRDVAGDARIWRIIPLTFFLAGTLMSFQGLWAGPYLFDIYGLNDIGAGNVLLALGVGTTLGFGGSGWACDRFGLARTMVAVSAVFIASQFALAVRPPLAVVTSALCFIFGLMGGFIN